MNSELLLWHFDSLSVTVKFHVRKTVHFLHLVKTHSLPDRRPTKVGLVCCEAVSKAIIPAHIKLTAYKYQNELKPCVEAVMYVLLIRPTLSHLTFWGIFFFKQNSLKVKFRNTKITSIINFSFPRLPFLHRFFSENEKYCSDPTARWIRKKMKGTVRASSHYLPHFSALKSACPTPVFVFIGLICKNH